MDSLRLLVFRTSLLKAELDQITDCDASVSEADISDRLELVHIVWTRYDRCQYEDFTFDNCQEMINLKVQALHFYLSAKSCLRKLQKKCSPCFPNLSFSPLEENIDDFIKRLYDFFETYCIKGKLKSKLLLLAIGPCLRQKLYSLCRPVLPSSLSFETLASTLKLLVFKSEPHATKCHRSFETGFELSKNKGRKNTCPRNPWKSPGYLKTKRKGSFRSGQCLQINEQKNLSNIFWSRPKVKCLNKKPERVSHNSKEKCEAPKRHMKDILNLNGPDIVVQIPHMPESYPYNYEEYAANVGNVERLFKNDKSVEMREAPIGNTGFVNYSVDTAIPEVRPGEDAYCMNVIMGGAAGKFLIDTKIDGRALTMEMDTGAAVSTLSYKDYLRLGLKKRLFATDVELRTYTGEPLVPRGVAFVHCFAGGRQFYGKLYVIDRDVDPIFSRDWLRHLRLRLAEVNNLSINRT